MKKNRIRKLKGFSGVTIWAVIACLAVLVFLKSFYSLEEKTIETVFIRVFGFVRFDNSNVFFISVVQFLLPQIGMMLIWGNYFDETITKNVDIIFTRTRKAGSVVWKETIQLILGVAITTACLEGGVCAVYKGKGYHISNGKSLLINAVLYIVYMMFVLLLANILSFLVQLVYSIVLSLFLQLLALEIVFTTEGTSMQNKWYRFNPVSAVMFLKNQNNRHPYGVFWFCYLTVLMLILVGTCCFVTRKKEYI